MTEKKRVFIDEKDLKAFNEFNNSTSFKVSIHNTIKVIDDKKIYQITIENINRNANDLDNYLQSLTENIDLL